MESTLERKGECMWEGKDNNQRPLQDQARGDSDLNYSGDSGDGERWSCPQPHNQEADRDEIQT